MKNGFKIACAFASLALNVAVYINAFGLTVQNWWWLIGGSIGTWFLVGLVSIGDEK